ncbi:hypothetical protein Godav_029698, partial [Gossypium davidsonii]|nr:hypothetical protein [Gossypium davidsonii]
MLPDDILYRCGDGYKKNIREMSNAWNQTQRMKRLAVGSIAAPEYIEWWGRRINDNISGPSQGDKKSLLEIQNEKGELKARVAELEKTLYQYRNRNSVIEL